MARLGFATVRNHIAFLSFRRTPSRSFALMPERCCFCQMPMERPRNCFSLRGNDVVIASRSLTMRSPSVASFRRFSFAGAPRDSSKKPVELTEKLYHAVADETLDSLTAFFDEIGDSRPCHPAYDVSFSNGVLTVKIRPGETYVVNKQSPNKQIWLSSPFSGPKRYDFADGAWSYLHDGRSLHELLTAEISLIFNDAVDFTGCSHGKRNAAHRSPG